MKPASHRPRRRSVQGVALIEALVGVLIFSIGILGLVGLQASMTRAQGSAKFRADAAYLSSDLLGQMWADRTNRALYNQPGTCTGHSRCQDWLNKVASTLPQGTAVLSTTADGTVSMTVTWTANAEGSHSYVLHTAIR
jgi:type IV pilus assembly protein PilV